ncbi:hypothetical protein [Occallatibacter savannae]|uniref:hypothetical protein n=1 Tax=Occallatibacter savannae TaxID=1002691 RepID=UPI000D69E485|nr:hypothetical protein [Occallatibacter savannae]
MTSQERAKIPNDGASWFKLAVAFQISARYKDSERAYKKAVRLLKTEGSESMSDALDGMGTMYVQIRKYEKARTVETEALLIREAKHDAVGVGLSWMHLALVSLGQHRLPDAEMFAEMAVHRLVPERTNPTMHSTATADEKMTALVYLAEIRCAQVHYDDAIPELVAALGIAKSVHPAGSPLAISYIKFLLGYAIWKNGEPGRAAELFESGIRGLQATVSPTHPTFTAAVRQYKAFLNEIHGPHSVEARRLGFLNELDGH